MATQIRDTTNKNSKEHLERRRHNRIAWLFSFGFGGLFGVGIFLILVGNFGNSIGFWTSTFVGIAAGVVFSVFCRIIAFAERYNPRQKKEGKK